MVSMPRPVKRPYDTTTRDARSAQTRQRIIDTARRLIIERGYRATTIAAVATEAGVHVDTVYSLVGRKPTLLTEIIEQALSGTDHAVAAEEREFVKAIRAEPDPAAEAGALRARHPRDPRSPGSHLRRPAGRVGHRSRRPSGLAGHQRAARREHDDVRSRAAHRRRPAPRPSIAEAADTVWATNSPEVYVLLTVERGWTPDRYERWLADSWRRLLLR